MNESTLAPRKVFLFSGHMVDAPGRKQPRFPPAQEPVAAQAIGQCLAALEAGPQDLAICGGACGGDLLFAEAALARGTPLELYLPFDASTFVVESVDFAGGDWPARFAEATRRAVAVHVLPRERGPLPAGADPYEANNLWMLEAAGRHGSERVDFVCLWNGQGGDGPGGTQHLMQEVQRHQGRTHWLDTRQLWQGAGDAPAVAGGPVPRPLCFMVMPFGRKSTLAEAGSGPTEIDFNRLWDLAYVPVIESLGYEAVRADQDTGSLIVTEMLERLYFADLVLADMTIPNGNVYYEIGVRHAARSSGCVLLAADWSKQLFDVAQMRTVRYPLPEGEITPATAEAIQAAIRSAIPALAVGASPMHAAIPGYPSQVNEADALTMKSRMAGLAALQGEIRAVRSASSSGQMAAALSLAGRYAGDSLIGAAALSLMRLLADCADTPQDWNAVVGFVDGLKEPVRSLPEVREQRAMALSYAGQHLEAIRDLQTLVDGFGPTPERLGLLGGRYKRLYNSKEAEPRDRAAHLRQAIDHYERGMELDLNEYYCACNLPHLYRERGRAGDEEKAQTVLRLVVAACQRAQRRGAVDPWLRRTLLGAAFNAADPAKAEELVDQVLDEGPARWEVDSLRADLRASVAQVRDEAVRQRLQQLLDRLSV